MNQAYNQLIVENCKFKFKCSKTWGDLEAKNIYAENKRYCNDCSRDVYLIKTDTEFTEAVSNDFCIAIPVELIANQGLTHQEPPPYLIGSIDPSGTEWGRSGRQGWSGLLILFLLIGLVFYFLFK